MTIQEFDGLIERLNLLRDGDPISQTDAISVLNILHQIRDKVIANDIIIDPV